MQVDTAVADFIFGCGLPFSLAAHVLFKKLLMCVATYGQAYTPPAPSTLATTHLLRAKRKVEEDLETGVRAGYNKYGYTMASDGWSDTRNRCGFTFCAVFLAYYRQILSCLPPLVSLFFISAWYTLPGTPPCLPLTAVC